MNALLDLGAADAHAAAAAHARLGRTVQRLRQPQRHRVLADRSRAAELVPLGDVAADRLLPELLEEATLPDHISHWAERIVRVPDPRWAMWRPPRTGARPRRPNALPAAAALRTHA